MGSAGLGAGQLVSGTETGLLVPAEFAAAPSLVPVYVPSSPYLPAPVGVGAGTTAWCSGGPLFELGSAGMYGFRQGCECQVFLSSKQGSIPTLKATGGFVPTA